jgi:hypothetical protein
MLPVLQRSARIEEQEKQVIVGQSERRREKTLAGSSERVPKERSRCFGCLSIDTRFCKTGLMPGKPGRIWILSLLWDSLEQASREFTIVVLDGFGESRLHICPGRFGPQVKITQGVIELLAKNVLQSP